MTDDRYEKGMAILGRLKGSIPQETQTNKDLMKITVEHLFGDIWSRPGLALRDRELITIAVLVAMDHPPQLQLHLKGALNAGVSREEIIEVMIQLAHYAGWPKAFNGLAAAEAVFDELDAA